MKISTTEKRSPLDFKVRQDGWTIGRIWFAEGSWHAENRSGSSGLSHACKETVRDWLVVTWTYETGDVLVHGHSARPDGSRDSFFSERCRWRKNRENYPGEVLFSGRWRRVRFAQNGINSRCSVIRAAGERFRVVEAPTS